MSWGARDTVNEDRERLIGFGEETRPASHIQALRMSISPLGLTTLVNQRSFEVVNMPTKKYRVFGPLYRRLMDSTGQTLYTLTAA